MDCGSWNGTVLAVGFVNIITSVDVETKYINPWKGSWKEVVLMIYRCAGCDQEIKKLRTLGKKVNKDFYCKKCAHENHEAFAKNQEKMVKYLQNRP